MDHDVFHLVVYVWSERECSALCRRVHCDKWCTQAIGSESMHCTAGAELCTYTRHVLNIRITYGNTVELRNCNRGARRACHAQLSQCRTMYTCTNEKQTRKTNRKQYTESLHHHQSYYTDCMYTQTRTTATEARIQHRTTAFKNLPKNLILYRSWKTLDNNSAIQFTLVFNKHKRAIFSSVHASRSTYIQNIIIRKHKTAVAISSNSCFVSTL